MLGNVNWTFGLLGFLWYGSYTYDPSIADAMKKEVDEWLKKLDDSGMENSDSEPKKD